MNIIWIIVSLLIDSRAERLYERTIDLPDVRPDLVMPAVQSALLNETPDIPAELMIAIAWGETRLNPTTITGHVCGPMSTVAKNMHECRKLFSHIEGYKAGVAELEKALQDSRVHGDMRLALLYFACGNSAFNGTCTKGRWPTWVLGRAKALTRPLKGSGHSGS